MLAWVGTTWASFGGWLVLAGVTMLAAAWGLMSATAHTRMATAANAMLVMLIGGLWHGAHLNFVTWGAINGAALVAWICVPPPLKGSGVVRWVGCSRFMWWSSAAFGFALEAWCFGHQTTRQHCLEGAWDTALQLWTNLTSPRLSTSDFTVDATTWLALGLMILGYLLHLMPSSVRATWEAFVEKWPLWAWWGLWMACAVLAVWGQSGPSRPFIYWQF